MNLDPLYTHFLVEALATNRHCLHIKGFRIFRAEAKDKKKSEQLTSRYFAHSLPDLLITEAK